MIGLFALRMNLLESAKMTDPCSCLLRLVAVCQTNSFKVMETLNTCGWIRLMLFHAFACFSMLFHAFPCFSMLFHAFPCFSMLSHCPKAPALVRLFVPVVSTYWLRYLNDQKWCRSFKPTTLFGWHAAVLRGICVACFEHLRRAARKQLGMNSTQGHEDPYRNMSSAVMQYLSGTTTIENLSAYPAFPLVAPPI